MSIWAIPNLDCKFCESRSWNGPEFWYVVVLQKLSLKANFQPPRCNFFPATPLRSFEICRFYACLKIHISAPKRPISIKWPAFSRFYLQLTVKNYRNALASQPYVSVRLKPNTVSSKWVTLKNTPKLEFDSIDIQLPSFWRFWYKFS